MQVTHIYVKAGPNVYKDGGTKEYHGWDGNKYFQDFRIGSTTQGKIFDRYPDDINASLIVNAKLVECNVPPDEDGITFIQLDVPKFVAVHNGDKEVREFPDASKVSSFMLGKYLRDWSIYKLCADLPADVSEMKRVLESK